VHLYQSKASKKDRETGVYFPANVKNKDLSPQPQFRYGKKGGAHHNGRLSHSCKEASKSCSGLFPAQKNFRHKT